MLDLLAGRSPADWVDSLGCALAVGCDGWSTGKGSTVVATD